MRFHEDAILPHCQFDDRIISFTHLTAVRVRFFKSNCDAHQVFERRVRTHGNSSIQFRMVSNEKACKMTNAGKAPAELLLRMHSDTETPLVHT